MAVTLMSFLRPCAQTGHCKCTRVVIVHRDVHVLCTLHDVVYRTLALLSACAYIPTGRKPALNNDRRLTVSVL